MQYTEECSQDSVENVTAGPIFLECARDTQTGIWPRNHEMKWRQLEPGNIGQHLVSHSVNTPS